MSNSRDFIIENGVLEKYNGPGGDVVIPDGVTAIGNSVFQFHRLTSVTIPDSVTSIGERAFDHCGLTSITIPSSVTTIGQYAFNCCLDLPADTDGFVIVGKLLVAYKGFASVVTIPSGVTAIGDRAFYDCRSLTCVAIPEGVTSIGDEAFYNCRSLTSVTIPSTVTSIGRSAFYRCSRLTSVTVPDGVEMIGNGVFSECERLVDISLPDSVGYIAPDAFKNAAFFDNENAWDGKLLYVGNHLFKADPTITGTCVIRPGTRTIVCGAFSGCMALTGVVIPEGVTSIGENAFSDCSSLTSVKIPESVGYVDSEAFKNARSLFYVKLPRKLNEGLQLTSFMKATIVRQDVEDADAVRSKETIGVRVLRLDNHKRITYVGMGEHMVYSLWNFTGHNLKQYGTEEFSWKRYDENIINNGPDYALSNNVRQCSALFRLLDPEELSDEARDAFVEIVGKKPEAVLRLAELEEEPEMVRLLFRIGAVKKAFLKKIAASPVLAIAAVASENIPVEAGTAESSAKNGKKAEKPEKKLSDVERLTMEALKNG